VAVFEIANIYLPEDGQNLPNQPRRLAIGMTGARELRSWLPNTGSSIDFYDLKGIVETLCSRLGVEIQVEPTQNPTFYPGRVAGIQVNGTEIGVFGEVHPLVCGAFNLPAQGVCLLELDLEALLAAVKPNVLFQSISRMPKVREDLALVVAEDVHSDDVARTIREAGGSLLVDVVLFDVYRGKQLGEGRKSLAYSLTFQAEDRTLTTEETTKLRAKILRQVEAKYQAQLRA
jgi:phenylalanyl-tRNA synthetase beta chain